MYRIIFLTAARTDILKASDWYESQNEGLGQKFNMTTIRFIDSLQSDFIQYGEVYNGLSRIFIKGFPYQVFFKKDGNTKIITVFAVLHNKQSRSILNKRT